VQTLEKPALICKDLQKPEARIREVGLVTTDQAILERFAAVANSPERFLRSS